MDKWLAAAIAADRESEQRGSDLPIQVRKVQKVQQRPETDDLRSYCTFCTNCRGKNRKETGVDIEAPIDWKEGYDALNSTPGPQTISESRWHQLLQDATTFMCCWSGKAHVLGWSTLEVFGVHPLAPVYRPDSAGLVWLLNGHEIAAMMPDKAIIRTLSGSSLTHLRGITGAVPVWELVNRSSQQDVLQMSDTPSPR